MEMKVIVEIETDDSVNCNKWCNFLDFDKDTDYEITTYCKLFEKFLQVNVTTDGGKTVYSIPRCAECLSATV